MSAYVVTTETMHWMCTGLYSVVTNDGRRNLQALEHDAAPLGRYGNKPIVLDSFDAMTELGNALFRMNEDAVNQRYDEQQSIVSLYQFRRRLKTDPTGGLLNSIKATSCYRYQVAEGDIDNQPLRKWLEIWYTRMLEAQVKRIPGYETLPWDFPDPTEKEVRSMPVSLADLAAGRVPTRP